MRGLGKEQILYQRVASAVKHTHALNSAWFHSEKANLISSSAFPMWNHALHTQPTSFFPEVESSRTSLASRTHSDVLGLGLEGQVLGLEASSPGKLPCTRLEDSTICWIVKSLWSAWKIFWKTVFSGNRLKIFSEDLFFWRALALVSLALTLSVPVLGLKRVCPR